MKQTWSDRWWNLSNDQRFWITFSGVLIGVAIGLLLMEYVVGPWLLEVSSK